MRLAQTLAALFGALFIAALGATSPALATSGFAVVTDDSFSRANSFPGIGAPPAYTSPSNGGAYQDVQGSAWSLSNNAVGSFSAISGSGYLSYWLLRPAAEDTRDSQVSVTATLLSTGEAEVALLRANHVYGSGNLAFAAYVYKGGHLALGSISNQAFTSCASDSSYTPTASSYVVTLSAIGASPTTLTATLALASAPSTVVSTATCSTSAGPQVAGAAGLTATYLSGRLNFTHFTSYQQTSTPATAYALQGPASGAVNTTSAPFSVYSNGVLSGAVTVTPTDGGAGGSFSPTSLSLTPTIPVATFTYASPAARQTVSMTSTNNGPLTQSPTPFSYSVTFPPLTVGAITATPAAGKVTLSTSAALAGGSGAGLSYLIYRGTDPNFVVGASSLLTTPTSLPYVDTPPANVQEFYGIVGQDNASDSVNALPAGLTANTDSPTQLLYASAQAFPVASPAIEYIGDSLTYGYGTANPGSTTASTPPYYASQKLQKLAGLKSVALADGGVSGATSYSWCPGGTYWNNAIANNGSSSAATLFAANPAAKQVFHFMLGTNDSSPTYTQGPCGGATYKGSLLNADYVSNVETIIDGVISAWPNATVVWSMSPYYSPNTRNGATYEQAGLSVLQGYRTQLQNAINIEAAKHTGQVFLGDTYSFGWFSTRYAAELQGDTSGPNGTFYLHPSDTVGSDGIIGTQALGEMWASALAQDLYGVAGGTGLQVRYGPHSPVSAPLIH